MTKLIPFYAMDCECLDSTSQGVYIKAPLVVKFKPNIKIMSEREGKAPP